MSHRQATASVTAYGRAAGRGVARLGRTVQRHIAQRGVHRPIETGPNLRTRVVAGVAAVATTAIIVLGAFALVAARHAAAPKAAAAAAGSGSGPLAPRGNEPAAPIDPVSPEPTASASATNPPPSATVPAPPAGTTPAAPAVPAAPAAPPAKPPAAAKVSPLTADYGITRSFASGFVTEVTVTNRSGTDQSWAVTVANAESAGVAVLRSWSTEVTTSGSVIVFSGPPLAPGGAQKFGYEATKKTPGPVRPSRCTISGAACAVSG